MGYVIEELIAVFFEAREVAVRQFAAAEPNLFYHCRP